ncbi:2-polyprenyl-6-methoxyphenol hydroxylase [Burkholderia dolosa AU0158]|nr:2-polyprenyl-6-methoxyphenol hydroxylase [Burkholderia dolosa AU0158]
METDMSTRISTNRKVAIVGGSLGGLFAANLLLRNGWDVDVFERVPDALSARGAGIVTHPALFDVLRAAGVRIDESIGVNVDRGSRSRRTFRSRPSSGCRRR